jgi:aflatoxin B1 aldehyde reductase
MSPPEFIFGGGGLSDTWREDNISELIEALQQVRIHRIDSAVVYPYHEPGGADRLLGSSKFPGKGFAIDTKILYFGDGGGTMTAERYRNLSLAVSRPWRYRK